MTDAAAFALACLALLAAPGPTNTLLAMSGAAAGMTRWLALMAAVLAGYLLAIAFISQMVAPLIGESPAASIVLRLTCGAFLVWSAIRLWREGSSAIASSEPVGFGRLFVATLLNPKGLVFALVLIPHLGQRRYVEAAPYVAAFAAMTTVVAAVWIAVGVVIGAAAKESLGAGALRRVGASMLGLFGVLLSSSVLLQR